MSQQKVLEEKQEKEKANKVYAEFDEYLTREFVQVYQNGAGIAEAEKINLEERVNDVKKLFSLIQRSVAQVSNSDEMTIRLWDRVFKAFEPGKPDEKTSRIQPNIQCLIFLKLLKGKFSQFPSELQRKLLARLAGFYGKHPETAQSSLVKASDSTQQNTADCFAEDDQFPYNLVANEILRDGAGAEMSSPLRELNMAVSKFCKEKTFGKERIHDYGMLEHINFLKQQMKLIKQQGNILLLPPTPPGSPAKPSPREIKQDLQPEIEIVTVPSKSAYVFAGLWRVLMLPLSILEGLARGFDKLVEMAWQNKDKNMFTKIGAWALQVMNHLSLLVFAPEVLIQRYPEKKNWIRAGNIAAWIGLGICVPPLFAKIAPKLGLSSLSLPFVEMGKMSAALGNVANLSAAQTFWMTLMPAAYGVRQGLQAIGEGFDWGGEPPAERERIPEISEENAEIVVGSRNSNSYSILPVAELGDDNSNSNELGDDNSTPNMSDSQTISSTNNPMAFFNFGALTPTIPKRRKSEENLNSSLEPENPLLPENLNHPLP